MFVMCIYHVKLSDANLSRAISSLLGVVVVPGTVVVIVGVVVVDRGIVQGAPKNFTPLKFSDNISETAENF